MRSFSLLRANPLLSTNMKIVVDSDYKLYMESFVSNEDLGDVRFKKYEFKRSDTYDQLIPTFFKKVPSEIAFYVKYDEDNEIQFDDFKRQFDDTYTMGCSNIDDLDYSEEFECLAPLHIDIENIPEFLYIFRVDDSGLLLLDKDNFKEEIVKKFKCVTDFDLTKKTNLGEWLNNSFVDNREFPDTTISFDVRDSEFTQWKGIDYESGGYTEKSFFINDILDRETPFFEFDKFLTNGFRDNKVVYPNIVNFKFLFDDTPATPTTLRKWSINRYFGFFIDKKETPITVSPYSPSKLHNGFTIDNNNIIISNNKDPFIKGFVENGTFIEYKGEFYEVIEITSNTYKIISPYKLEDTESYINKEIITINDDNYINYNTDYNTSTFTIDNFDSADVWVININGKKHNIVKDSIGYKIYTDYAFSINDNILKYWINQTDESYTTTIDLSKVDSDNKPMNFNISKLNFTDIKDFDTDIVNSKWANIEYDKNDTVIDTLEPKMYSEDLQSNTTPLGFDEFVFNNDLVKIPTASEYSASQELFEITNPNQDLYKNLSDIWRKNPVFSKWGFSESLDMRDYPYRLNNTKFGDDYNRTSNTSKDTTDRMERNLDHFYTINPDSNTYDEYSLHITAYESDNKTLNKDYFFDLSKYFNAGVYSGNYFNYTFTKKEYIKGENIRNTLKYSSFINGDDDNTNETLFRGIKFRLYEVGKVITSNDIYGNIEIDSISILPSNDFDEWKFSITFTELSHNLDDVNFKETPDLSIKPQSEFEWELIDRWELNETYVTSSIVLYNDILFKSNDENKIENPNFNPGNSSSWDLATINTCYYNNTLIQQQAWVYYFNEYYTLNDVNGIDIWIPTKTYTINLSVDYTNTNTVIYNGRVYTSIIADNTTMPTDKSAWTLTKFNTLNPIPKENDVVEFKWVIVNLWSSNIIYNNENYTVSENKLYESQSDNNLNSDPSLIGNNWKFIHNIEQDTDKVYDTDRENNVVEMNDKYYLCKGNTNLETLENGINIYINKKWKNVLVNYYCNDNTFFDLVKNINRDDLYIEIFDKMTSYNLIESLSNMDTLSGFSDYIKYYIIEEDGSYTKYDINNILDLPYTLIGVGPDEYTTYVDSLQSKISTVNRNLYNPVSLLKKSTLNDYTEVNFYNDKNLGISFTKPRIYNGFNVNTKRYMNEMNFYRFNGNYNPIFKEIPLFKKPDIDDESININNFIFDTTLTSFGMIDERIISKVNIKKDLLEFKDNSEVKSIYPMIDEFGYTTIPQFIFKSTWDYRYLTNFEDKPTNGDYTKYNQKNNNQ